MPNNMVLLERIELNASAASVTFSNIPQTGYTDLKIVMSVRTTRAATDDAVLIRFNGSSTNFTVRELRGTGSSTFSGSGTTPFVGYQDGNTATSNTFSNAEIYIPNYAGSTNKSFSVDSVQETNATGALQGLIAGLWSNTAAITSITLVPEIGPNFVANSTFSLYGLAALGTTPVIAPKASGGNVIATDGTYWYHAFLASGTFVPQLTLSCDVLVVAGGGGGGGYVGGGGGAGGLLGHASQSLTATNYSITVGAGGGGGTGTTKGSNGANSQFGSLTASVGGGGGATYNYPGGNAGGSGGGGTAESPNTGGTATSGQGFNGGAGGSGVEYPSGGGGGAGAVGAAGSGLQGGAGGVGSTTYSSWGLATTTGQNVSGTVYYAGGGGGGVYRQTTPSPGAGGFGGGGAGGATPTTAGNNATINTGGGGGGATSATPTVKLNGGTGGSGIVIIRYPIA